MHGMLLSLFKHSPKRLLIWDQSTKCKKSARSTLFSSTYRVVFRSTHIFELRFCFWLISKTWNISWRASLVPVLRRFRRRVTRPDLNSRTIASRPERAHCEKIKTMQSKESLRVLNQSSIDMRLAYKTDKNLCLYDKTDRPTFKQESWWA